LWATNGTAEEEVAELLDRSTREASEVEQWHERADGSVFWAECTVSPVLNDELHGFTVVSKDATARKQYERMLERQNDRLKEFTDILSHDLQSPLNVITGRLDLYRETGEEVNLDIIEETTTRMTELVSDMLRVAQQGKVVRNPERIDIYPVLLAVKQTELPATASLEVERVPKVMASPTRLRQLFENVFRNAVRHGGEDVTVRVGPLDGGFYVEDDGPGIPDDLQSKVFDHGFTTHQDGNGFGLSVVRTIVGAHGWDVVATTAESGGARFEITGAEFMSASTNVDE
jgi:signal transduction histidine kinase